MNNILKKVVGILLIIIGIFGLFLPLLQGRLLIGLGIYVMEYKPLNRLIKKWFYKCKSCVKNH